MFYSKKEMRKYRLKRFFYWLGCAAFVAVAEFILFYMLFNF